MTAAYLNALPSALVAVDRDLTVTYMNLAAEIMLATSAAQSLGKPLAAVAPGIDTQLIRRVLETSEEISLYAQTLPLPGQVASVNLHLMPVAGTSEVMLTIENHEGVQKLAASEWKKEATRVAGVMAAMLAHEVKNPLSGIRGAAQILKEEIGTDHQPLADLICNESDRIRDLLAQIDVFADRPLQAMQPVNIHEVLQYVIAIARSGFAREVSFKENYDPSLPPVLGSRDLLVQLMLNLVKNAAEATKGQSAPVVTLATGYRSGYRIRDPKTRVERSLPVLVSVSDNGPGIADAMKTRLFEPFQTSKGEGRGLGLAIVAKIASDLDAGVELDAEYGPGAKFNVMLPMTDIA
jgi:two-component system, NtrC family, nitrogen regulation sensor histidine kinase GlnL